MRKLSTERRRVVVLSSSLAAMSGLGPVLFPHHSVLGWVWLGLMAGLIVVAITLMVRLRRHEGCN